MAAGGNGQGLVRDEGFGTRPTWQASKGAAAGAQMLRGSASRVFTLGAPLLAGDCTHALATAERLGCRRSLMANGLCGGRIGPISVEIGAAGSACEVWLWQAFPGGI